MDLSFYFPDEYSDSEIHIIPLEFTGKIEFYETRNTVSAAIVGNNFHLQLEKNHNHFSELVNKIGMFRIELKFKEDLWSDYWMCQQLELIYRSLKLKEEHERYQFIEEF